MSGQGRKTATNTRRQLLESFNKLVLDGQAGKITVADVVREAGVGRSTFYDHYSSASDIHEQALSAPMTLLAESILGARTEPDLRHLLAHIWANRARARVTLFGEEGDKVDKLLISILESRLVNGGHPSKASTRILAIELAAAPLALIRAWLQGTVRCDETELAQHIEDASARVRKALLSA